MNQRQSLKAAAKHIEELEFSNSRYRNDVKAYNAVIDCLIAGGSACGWCEDQEECQREGKRTIPGCDEWMLGMAFGNEQEPVTEIRMEVEQDDAGRNQDDVSENVHATGSDRGAGDQDAEIQIESL